MNRELCCLKNMMRKAVDWGYLKDNPAWGIKQQRESPPEFEFLTEAEIDRLLTVVRTYPSIDGRSTGCFYTVLVVALYTGMRRGEIFKLAWSDVDFDKGENGLIALRDTKNGDTRYIPMNACVRTAL